MKYALRLQTLLALGLAIATGCESESHEDRHDTEPSMALDGGDVAPPPGDLCQQADTYFATELQRTAATQRACTRDADCTMWSPVLSCQGPAWQVLNCGLPVRNAAVPALELERTRVTNETCAMVDGVCAIGVSCPNARAVCTQSLCTATTSEPPQVPCSVDATSSELSGARIHIEADDCSFRPGEGGRFRYRVELPSSIDYEVAASESCGLCAQDRTDPSALVVARVGTGSTSYCPTCDVGCCAPDRAAQWTLQARSYEAVLEWPGRAWNGPSDTLRPLGAAFAPGRYDVDVTLQIPGVGRLTALLPIVVE